MSSPAAVKMSSLPSMKRQHLLAEFAGLKQACPQGIYVSLTPSDPSLWSGVIFVRRGPYANAILRFYISFPDTYPALPPLVTFSTDMFHPLVTPLTTYMYSTDVAVGGTVSASDEERLPPGGFSLRHGFPGWFGRGSRERERARVQAQAESQRNRSSGEPVDVMSTPPRAVATATGMTPASASSGVSVGSAATFEQTQRREVSTYEVLRYIRSTFDDEDVLDAVPIEAAGNPGAWHAWRTHRRQMKGKTGQGQGKGATAGEGEGSEAQAGEGSTTAAAAADAAGGSGPATTRRPEEWNWEGVWEERVKRGIAASLSEGVLFGNAGAADEMINFLNMDDAEVEGTKSNLLRTLGASA